MTDVAMEGPASGSTTSPLDHGHDGHLHEDEPKGDAKTVQVTGPPPVGRRRSRTFDSTTTTTSMTIPNSHQVGLGAHEDSLSMASSPPSSASMPTFPTGANNLSPTSSSRTSLATTSSARENLYPRSSSPPSPPPSPPPPPLLLPSDGATASGHESSDNNSDNVGPPPRKAHHLHRSEREADFIRVTQPLPYCLAIYLFIYLFHTPGKGENRIVIIIISIYYY